MGQCIEEIEFTIFDTETTGLDPQSKDRIVELAAIRIRDKDRLAYFDSLINPGRAVSFEAFKVNKISEEMLFSAPSPSEVIPKFMEFIQGSYLCSYNAGFDLSFLNNELNLLGFKEIKDVLVVDILKLARNTIPNLESYALWSVAKSLGIKDVQRHRALADVELTLQVFYLLNDIIKQRLGQPVKLENITNI